MSILLTLSTYILTNAMKKVTSVARTQIVITRRDLTNANARLVSKEMDTTAQVFQHFFSVVS